MATPKLSLDNGKLDLLPFMSTSQCVVSFMRCAVTYKELYEMLTFLVAIATSVALYARLANSCHGVVIELIDTIQCRCNCRTICLYERFLLNQDLIHQNWNASQNLE